MCVAGWEEGLRPTQNTQGCSTSNVLHFTGFKAFTCEIPIAGRLEGRMLRRCHCWIHLPTCHSLVWSTDKKHLQYAAVITLLAAGASIRAATLLLEIGGKGKGKCKVPCKGAVPPPVIHAPPRQRMEVEEDKVPRQRLRQTQASRFWFQF